MHGAEQLAKVQAASQALFGQGDLAALDEDTLAAAARAVPFAAIEAGSPLPAVADLMAACGIVASKSAARRAITEGGAYLNNIKVTAEDAAPVAADLLPGGFLILRRGKRTVGAVRVG